MVARYQKGSANARNNTAEPGFREYQAHDQTRTPAKRWTFGNYCASSVLNVEPLIDK